MNIYLIGFYDYKDDASDVQSIIKATTSKEAAIQYVLDAIENFKTKSNRIHDIDVIEDEDKCYWIIRYKHDENNEQCEHSYRIETIDLNDKEDVPNVRRPELEKRCEALTKHNDELKAMVAELKKNNSAAQCYLTFWDGGRYESLDHVLDNVHTAREILNGGQKGNTHILKLFEGWKSHDN